MPNLLSSAKPSLPLAAASVLALTCCASDADPSSQGASTPVVLTTFTVLADMAQAVGGERIEVRSITPTGAEVHEYDPTPSDIRGAAEADLVLENGMGLEDWLQQFIQHADAPAVTLTEGINAQPVTRLPGHPDDAGSSSQSPVNPHAWISPAQGETYIDNIEAALAEHFPDDAEHFARNAEEYRQQLSELHQQAQARFDDADAALHLVTCEGAFSYLTQEYGLGEHYLWPLNAENEGTAAQTQAQIDYVDSHGVPVIFCESTVNDSAQQQVAAETGAEMGAPLYVDSLSEGGEVPSYLDLLEYNIDRILTAYE